MKKNYFIIDNLFSTKTNVFLNKKKAFTLVELLMVIAII
ncbi:type II secretion system protein [bacterium]|nr:type II secretion system protein [bacterium]